MFGALAKTYWARSGIDPAKIVSVSIIAVHREEVRVRPGPRCTIRATGRGFRPHDPRVGRDAQPGRDQAGRAAGRQVDDPLGESTGAAVIFGATGGVMEAALRTAYEVITGETLPGIDLEMCRGMEGVKEATVQVGDLAVKVAVAHGLSNAAKIMDKIRDGSADWHFIEVMACPAAAWAAVGSRSRPRWRSARLARRRSTRPTGHPDPQVAREPVHNEDLRGVPQGAPRREVASPAAHEVYAEREVTAPTPGPLPRGRGARPYPARCAGTLPYREGNGERPLSGQVTEGDERREYRRAGPEG